MTTNTRPALCQNPPRVTDSEARFGDFELATSWTPGLAGRCNDDSHPDGVFQGFGRNCGNGCAL